MTKTKQQLLDEATTARHKLLTGTKVVSFNDGASTVQYNLANIKQLERYIDQLNIELNQSTRRRAPASMSF